MDTAHSARGAVSSGPEVTGSLAAREPEAGSAGSVRPSPLRTAVVLVLGGLLGALIGGVALGAGSNYAASALVQAAPVVLGGFDQSDSASTYVRNELVFAGTYRDEMAAAAAEAAGTPDLPPVRVVLTNGTTFLSFESSGTSAEAAVAAANASADYYIEQWRTRASGSLTRSIDIVDAQLADVLPASESAQDLRSTRSEVQTQLASVEAAERMVSAATVAAASRGSSALAGIILGGLVGVVVALLGLILVRRAHAANLP